MSWCSLIVWPGRLLSKVNVIDIMLSPGAIRQPEFKPDCELGYTQ